MSKTDLGEIRKAAEKEGMVGSSDIFKVKDGANRIRLVAGPLPHADSYKGTPNFKWLTYVIDRSDGTVKPYFMPHTIYRYVEDLQKSEDYGFDEIPMPYDVTINAKGAGTKEVEYSLMPAKNETPLTAEERNAIDAKMDLRELQNTLRAKKAEKNGDPQHFDPDDVIPT